MSTRYYYLREPVTGVSLDDHGHGRVTLHVTTASGSLEGEMSSEDVALIIHSLAESNADDSTAPIVSGCERVRGLDPNLTLISEYGEIMTVAEIRKKYAKP